MNYRLVASLALTSALGSMACGSDKPAQDPSTIASTETTSGQPAAAPTDLPASTNSTSPTAAADAPSTGGTSTYAPGPTTTMRTTSAGANTTTSTMPMGTSPPPPSTQGSNGLAPATQNPGSADQTKNADNTKINDRDRHGALTAMDQGGSEAERNITATIRKAVVADKSLSFGAKNVKIITNGGKVTLRGPVKTDAERSAIEAQARKTAGVTDVDNQLEVKK